MFPGLKIILVLKLPLNFVLEDYIIIFYIVYVFTYFQGLIYRPNTLDIIF